MKILNDDLLTKEEKMQLNDTLDIVLDVETMGNNAASDGSMVVSIVTITIAVTAKICNFVYNQLSTKTNFIKWLDKDIQK